MKRQCSSYDAAVVALNSLQSNAAVIASRRRDRALFPERNVEETAEFLRLAGYDAAALDGLRPVHVAGTKGKGSVCAFAEAALRAHGLRTGFFSSPHLRHVRERIRLDGQPISEEAFASYFWRVYNRLEAGGIGMPAYFKFMTVMAYVVFIEEAVDVAIVEVGIGGAYDCTNIIRNPAICAITTLDYDHMSILGHSIQEIAWNKAGIMKAGSVALTVPQPAEAMAVLESRARSVGCALSVVEELAASPDLRPGISGPQQRPNVALAAQIARLWLNLSEGQPLPESKKTFDVISGKSGESIRLPVIPPFDLTPKFRTAIEACRWPGRSQKLVVGDVTYLLDGAHTPKSVELCAEWASGELSGWAGKRVLLFHCTADRAPASLLPFLRPLAFDAAIFCPPVAEARVDPTSSQTNFMLSRDSQLERCEENRCVWASLGGSAMSVLPDLRAALRAVEELGGPAAVLVTGSLHLVGGALALLQPESD